MDMVLKWNIQAFRQNIHQNHRQFIVCLSGLSMLRGSWHEVMKVVANILYRSLNGTWLHVERVIVHCILIDIEISEIYSKYMHMFTWAMMAITQANLCSHATWCKLMSTCKIFIHVLPFKSVMLICKIFNVNMHDNYVTIQIISLHANNCFNAAYWNKCVYMLTQFILYVDINILHLLDTILSLISTLGA